MGSSFFECPFANVFGGGKGGDQQSVDIDPNTVRHGRIGETPYKLPRSSSSYSAGYALRTDAPLPAAGPSPWPS
jgi:hypothetical protein